MSNKQNDEFLETQNEIQEETTSMEEKLEELDLLPTPAKSLKNKIYKVGSKCPICSTPSEIICRCEVSQFRN